ncbi:TMEM175 family protein [Pseudonocardia xishanensis]|uniref:TMEM175 family protein n=1 Tax=Pseudonocardia xishanensis TaxID=630995 RepID=A0ABP8RY31_9PSEU
MTEPGSTHDGIPAADFEETDRGAAERLTFFSDAVVAIAITLLAIELQVPRGETAAELAAGFAADWGEYLAFLISFAVIARHWMSHHRLFRYVGRADTGIIWLNMLWLLLIVLTPFLTRFISEEQVDFPRFAVYALAQTLQTGTFAVLVLVLARTGAFIPGTPRHWLHRGWVASAVIGGAFLVSIPLFPLLGSWAFALWGVLPFLGGLVTDRLGITGKGVDA